ncbi:MAG: sodium:solute symporter family protein [Clostridiales bacterium]|nr:sodium:solute symporter family protein [Clostridiales bacterium]
MPNTTNVLVPNPKMLIMVILYVILMGVLGVLSSKKENQESMKDFALAGKGLGTWVLIGTFVSTWLGGGTITGSVNSLAYNYGLGPAFCYIIPSVLATILLYFLGPIVRGRGKLTIAELLEDSYGSTARMISAVIIALASFSIVSYQYRGLGIVLNATTGLSVNIATLIACILIVILAVSGGLRTVANTDAVSSAVMLFGLLLAVPFVIKAMGGLDWIIAQAAIEAPNTLTFTGGWGVRDYLVNLLPPLLLCLGDQNLYQRMAAARDDKSVRIGMIGWAIGMLVVCPIIAFLGWAGRMYFSTNIAASQSLIATSTITPWVIGGMMMAAATAFIITSGDSYLLSGATNIASDVYAFFKKDATDQQMLKVTRYSIVIFGAMALVILNFFPNILAIQYWSYTIVGAGITPSLLGCIICPNKVTKWGGLSSMVVGTLLTIGWEMLGHPFGVQTVLVAFPVSLLLLIVVSSLTNDKKA